MSHIPFLSAAHIICFCMLAGCANAQNAGPYDEQPQAVQDIPTAAKRTDSMDTKANARMRYIVIFNEACFSSGNDAVTREAEIGNLSNLLARKYNAEIIAIWAHALHGMSVEMSAESASNMANDPDVLEVKIDQPIKLDH